MAKNYFLIVDTETTQDSLVADFGAVLCDKKGHIIKRCAVMVDGVFTDSENHPLFFTSDPEGIWSKKGQDKRYDMYNRMMREGTRMVASVAAVNRWLERVSAEYNPILTAYNLNFDEGKCRNTGIDLTMFDRRFCLWYAAYSIFAHTKQYRETVLALHAFNAPTSHGNMSFKTNAETMARFVLGNHQLEDEPHTALEDAQYYELPILIACLKKWSVKKLLNDIRPYVWKDCQVKDWFKP